MQDPPFPSTSNGRDVTAALSQVSLPLEARLPVTQVCFPPFFCELKLLDMAAAAARSRKRKLLHLGSDDSTPTLIRAILPIAALVMVGSSTIQWP